MKHICHNKKNEMAFRGKKGNLKDFFTTTLFFNLFYN